MSRQFRACLVMLGFLLLAACEVNQTPDLKTFLMENPAILTKEIADCEASKLPAARCLVVSTAATEFNALLSDAQHDPQGFGDRILKAEMETAQTGKSTDNVKVLIAVVSLTLHE